MKQGGQENGNLRISGQSMEQYCGSRYVEKFKVVSSKRHEWMQKLRLFSPEMAHLWRMGHDGLWCVPGMPLEDAAHLVEPLLPEKIDRIHLEIKQYSLNELRQPQTPAPINETPSRTKVPEKLAQTIIKELNSRPTVCHVAWEDALEQLKVAFEPTTPNEYVSLSEVLAIVEAAEEEHLNDLKTLNTCFRALHGVLSDDMLLALPDAILPPLAHLLGVRTVPAASTQLNPWKASMSLEAPHARFDFQNLQMLATDLKDQTLDFIREIGPDTAERRGKMLSVELIGLRDPRQTDDICEALTAFLDKYDNRPFLESMGPKLKPLKDFVLSLESIEGTSILN